MIDTTAQGNGGVNARARREESARNRREEIADWLTKQTTERDTFAAEVSQLKAEAAGMLFKIEALQTQLADTESKAAGALALRDQAIADRAAYETMFISFYAQMRAFKVPAAPLVKENPPDDEAPIGGA
jgi:hypothetical protein